MFRLTEHEALINRLGFNNKGVDHLVERLKSRRFKGPSAPTSANRRTRRSIAQPTTTASASSEVHPHCDYVTVNISSPNTANLRELQDTGPLRELLAELTGLRETGWTPSTASSGRC
jgi:dihydroorotate dehydrogenase